MEYENDDEKLKALIKDITRLSSEEKRINPKVCLCKDCLSLSCLLINNSEGYINEELIIERSYDTMISILTMLCCYNISEETIKRRLIYKCRKINEKEEFKK